MIGKSLLRASILTCNPMERIDSTAFLNLTKTEQVIMVIRSGEELLIRHEKGFAIHLFCLENLLVELWYIANSSKIVKTRLSSKEKVAEEYPLLWEQIQNLLVKRKFN
ncbi:MAG: hypothetical protein A2W85_17025 [Bacteroidetes bacterium GWF2_41_31]|nr:MAG: hypothetical protein A2W85_17025 [Bacteroidetes bacterium GWF2_41_31]OFZ08493.1 MAG: hypothetical protein A2338_08950 [Bacteroidetes bacterium RIFOXYB12_FULL_41_6]